jgi:hypothetical protein
VEHIKIVFTQALNQTVEVYQIQTLQLIQSICNLGRKELYNIGPRAIMSREIGKTYPAMRERYLWIFKTSVELHPGVNFINLFSSLSSPFWETKLELSFPWTQGY